MKKFVFSRYINVCRKQFIDDFRRQIGFTAVMSILLFFIFWIVNWQIGMAQMTEYSDSAVDMTAFFSWWKIAAFVGVVMLAIGYQSAHCMPFMKSKTAQIAHTVLPATTLEKYAAAETFAFVFSILEAVAAFFIADGLQYLLNGHFTLTEISSADMSALQLMFPDIQTFDYMFTLLILTMVASIFFHSAWFTFCATFLRKHPFLFGILILWGVNQIVSIAFSSISLNFLSYFNMMVPADGMNFEEIFEKAKTIFYVAIFGQLALSIGFWIWSYFRMKRVEL